MIHRVCLRILPALLAIPGAGCFTTADLEVAPPPGAAVGARPDSAGGEPTRVFLFRGIDGATSPGLDAIAARLSAAGHRAEVLPALEGVLARLPADGPLVMGGHSAGAFNAVRHAVHAKRPVDLLVLIDPPIGPRRMPIPAGVARVLVIRGWAAEVAPADPRTRVDYVEVGSSVPLAGFLWNRTLGHLGVTQDPRTVAAAVEAISAALAAGDRPEP
jgi:pimeloyl-ACP methyl ester carboxylesterase